MGQAAHPAYAVRHRRPCATAARALAARAPAAAQGAGGGEDAGGSGGKGEGGGEGEPPVPSLPAAAEQDQGAPWPRERSLPLPPSPQEQGQGEGEEERGEEPKSFRPDVSRAEIERFLQALGQAVRQPRGRLYLVGGAALVHAQIRGHGATTAAIDLMLAVPDEHQVQTAIRRLKNQLGVHVGLAGPADLMPAPSSWETASRYAGRYGALDVCYLDFTTLALAKIARSTSRDLSDLELLAAQGLTDRAGLEAAYREIRPQLGMGRFFNVDPAQFDHKIAVVVQHLWGPSTPLSTP